jgi:ubiquinone/menaquinone biosynthesis C-methylase UbiE
MLKILMSIFALLFWHQSALAEIIEVNSEGVQLDVLDDEETWVFMPASDPKVSGLLTPEIRYSKTGKSFVTYNKFGFDTTGSDINWLIEEFLSNAIKNDTAQSLFLEIGSGYGNIAKKFFKETQQAKLLANDLSKEHLLLVKSNVEDKNLERLFLNYQSFPNLTVKDGSIQAVMAHRIFHFLTGKQIEEGLKKIHTWLKPTGKLYIAVNSPYNSDFPWFLDEYQAKLAQNNPWPGENLPVAKALPNQAYALPEYLHVMDDTVLLPQLKKAGFKIVHWDFISMKNFQDKTIREGKEVFGVIVEKI